MYFNLVEFVIWGHAVVGSNPTIQTINFFGGVAQLVEQLVCTEKVESSNLSTSTTFSRISSVGRAMVL